MLSEILMWLYYVTLFCAVLASVILWSYLDRAGRLLGIILIATFAIEIIRATVRFAFAWIDSILEIIVFVGEVLGYVFLYLLTVQAGLLSRKMRMLSIVLILIIPGNALFLQPMPQAQTNLYQFESVLLAILAIHALYRLSVSPLSKNLLKTPTFWFWAMILIYQCSTLSFWGSQQLLKSQSKTFQAATADAHVVLNIIQYMGMAYGLLLYKPQKLYP